MDVIRTIARERHFHTAELTMHDFGTVLLIGDGAAVDRLLQLVEESDAHDLMHVDALPAATDDNEPPADLTRLRLRRLDRPDAS